MNFGIDIGASHIGLGLVNKQNKLIKKKYIPYKRPLKIFNKIFTKYFTNKYVENLIKEIDLFIDKEKISYIGLGCPGGVDINNQIFYGSKALVVGIINFKEVLSKYKCPIYIDNDCNCAAVCEAYTNNYDNFLMITIGTGAGFALVKKENNKIYLSKDEKIWKILDINKIPNTKHDKYIMSFKKLSNLYNQKVKRKKPRDAIFNDINNNQELIDNYIDSFVKGINLINEKIPIKNICLGGSFSLYHHYYLNNLQKKLDNYNIFIAKNNNDSGIIGATHLPIDRY